MSCNSESWRPNATLATLRARALMLEQIRAFFAKLGVLEVETPTCSQYAATDPALTSFSTTYCGPGHSAGLPLYLHTSPEFFMKRLLAANSGSIYQICRVYRNGELGRFHNLEFTLLEWYRPGFNYHELMDEVFNLITTIAGYSIPQQRLTYAELFTTYLGLNPHHNDIKTLRNCAVNLLSIDLKILNLTRRQDWLDLLFTHVIEPQLPKDTAIFVYAYPAEQASLARIIPGTPPIAERFELYLGGIEIANGFHELEDAVEQEQRFLADLAIRKTHNQKLVPLDQQLLKALHYGLPDCSGVAIGLDRLLMWLLNAKHINEVLTFSIDSFEMGGVLHGMD